MGSVGATLPRGSDDQARHPFEGEPQDGLVRAGAEQVQHDPGLPFDHAGGDLQRPQAQRVELGDAQEDRAGIRRRSDHSSQQAPV